MIPPGEAPLGMVCGNPAPTFLIVGTRGHALHCDAGMALRSRNPLIENDKLFDIALPFPKIGLDTGRCCGEAGVMGTNGSGRRTGRVADNGAAEARVRSAVLTIARLLGRQIAREQFERQSAANDNAPTGKAGGQKEQ